MTTAGSLVRYRAVTPLHLGAAEGAAQLLRPTHRDAASGLPLIPGSAIKGVLAGRLGEGYDPEPAPAAEAGTRRGRSGGEQQARPAGGEPSPDSAERERLYGSPDRGTVRGEAAAVVLGDAGLIAFPVPTLAGGPAWAIPAAAVIGLLAADGTEAGAEPGSEPLATIPAEAAKTLADLAGGSGAGGPAGRSGRLLGLPAPAMLDSSIHFGAAERPPAEMATALEAGLRAACGAATPAAAPLLLADPDAARALWELAAERRTLTALTPETRTVKDGTLRTVELIPAGAVFVGRVTLIDERRPQLDPLQVGAWEGLGFGWLRRSWIDGDELAAGERSTDATTGTPEPPPSGADLAGLIRRASTSVLALAGAPPRVRIAARAATYNFGPRARLQGLEAAVAFSLARAHPAHPKPSAEARGQRWLLGALLSLGDRLHEDGEEGEGRCPPLVERMADEPFAPARLARRRAPLMTRWLWLRRFVEADLETGDESEENGAATATGDAEAGP